MIGVTNEIKNAMKCLRDAEKEDDFDRKRYLLKIAINEIKKAVGDFHER